MITISYVKNNEERYRNFGTEDYFNVYVQEFIKRRNQDPETTFFTVIIEPDRVCRNTGRYLWAED